MKRTTLISTILSLFGLLSLACNNKSAEAEIYDYSIFPQNSIIFGEMKEGNTFYLIREDSIEMAGTCFIDNNRAVVERISFFADSKGETTFMLDEITYSAKMVVDSSSSEIELIFPDIVEWGISHQTVRLKYLRNIPEKVDCTERYKEPIFEKVVVEKDIKYGRALGYYCSKPSDYISKEDYKKWFSEMFTLSLENNGFLFKKDMQQLPLDMNIYLPENDNINKRPLLLLVHGGAFFFGDKENKTQEKITEYAVKRGFAVASINYRLGTSITPGSIERTIYRAVQDVRASVRYLVHFKEKYGIDEEQIYLAGNSAGGVICLTTAFMDNDEIYSSIGSGWFNQRENLGGLDDSGNNLKESFQIAGVVSLWGGVTNLKMLNKKIPTLLFHGTADDIIPHDEGLPFKNFMTQNYLGRLIYNTLSSFGKIYGSERIYSHLKSLKIPVTYIPFKDAGHDLQLESNDSLNENMNIICSELSNFLYYNVSKHYFNYQLTGKTHVDFQDSPPIYLLENIANTVVKWEVDGGFITKQTNDSISVIWYSNCSTGMVRACITNENGVSCKKELKVKIEI
ncbi:MAG: alpha/beta hydrolase [Bacteroidales bacterium]|jgi:acetyl esterase/lipase|nr:alpha/beta hydrolase [Bacteroidales bacterium]